MITLAILSSLIFLAMLAVVFKGPRYNAFGDYEGVVGFWETYLHLIVYAIIIVMVGAVLYVVVVGFEWLEPHVMKVLEWIYYNLP